MTTSINTLPRLRTVATRNDVADLTVVHAFGEGNLNPGRSYSGRETIADGWDPLSMEGPHRSTWHLTGYRLVGQTSTRAVYVWRFAVNGTSSTKYAAAVVDISRTPASVVVVHACDYQPAEETTRGGAEEKAATLLAELQAADGSLTDAELARVAVGRYTRLTVDQVAEALTAPAGQRPRIYAYWREQIVSVPSDYYLDRYREEARAYWLSGNTLADLIRRA